MSLAGQNLLVLIAVVAAAAYLLHTVRGTLARRRSCGGCGTCVNEETATPQVFGIGSSREASPTGER